MLTFQLGGVWRGGKELLLDVGNRVTAGIRWPSYCWK